MIEIKNTNQTQNLIKQALLQAIKDKSFGEFLAGKANYQKLNPSQFTTLAVNFFSKLNLASAQISIAEQEIFMRELSAAFKRYQEHSRAIFAVENLLTSENPSDFVEKQKAIGFLALAINGEFEKKRANEFMRGAALLQNPNEAQAPNAENKIFFTDNFGNISDFADLREINAFTSTSAWYESLPPKFAQQIFSMNLADDSANMRIRDEATYKFAEIKAINHALLTRSALTHAKNLFAMNLFLKDQVLISAQSGILSGVFRDIDAVSALIRTQAFSEEGKQNKYSVAFLDGQFKGKVFELTPHALRNYRAKNLPLILIYQVHTGAKTLEEAIAMAKAMKLQENHKRNLSEAKKTGINFSADLKPQIKLDYFMENNQKTFQKFNKTPLNVSAKVRSLIPAEARENALEKQGFIQRMQRIFSSSSRQKTQKITQEEEIQTVSKQPQQPNLSTSLNLSVATQQNPSFPAASLGIAIAGSSLGGTGLLGLLSVLNII
jgi:hypothetical protein